MDPTSEPPSVDELIAELQARVDDRERRGFYPTDLSQRLHEHFQRIAAHRSAPDLDELRRAVAMLDTVGFFSPERIPTGSSTPGGQALHRAIGRIVARQTQGVLEQVQQFADSLRVILRLMLQAIEEPHGHVHADLVGQLDALFEQLAALERGPVSSQASVSDLRRRVEALEAAENDRSFRPFFESARFEESFRGERHELLERYRDLAARLDGCGPVVDIGCGRGEFLELLKERGTEARGIEIDARLIEDCTARGLDVEEGDAIAFLEKQPDGHFGAITLIQVIEHLTPQQAAELVLLAEAKLRPGGRLVVETVNPQSLYVYAHAFYLDPTHTQPVHPAYLAFLVREAGFREVLIDWRSEPPSEEVLELLDADDTAGKAFNENIRRLNQLLFAPQDYALIATR